MSDFKVQKNLILVGLALVFLVDGALAYHNATAAAREENPDQALKLQALQLGLLKADVERAAKIKSHMPEVQKYFDQFETTLPPVGKGYSVISQEFDDVSKDAHVQLQDLKFRQQDVKGRNVDEVEIQATLSGDYTGIVKFLNRLQRSKNTYIVDSLGLDSETGPGPSGPVPPGSVRVSLHLRSYFRKA
jgi:Type II secretion system (T2SS), protein M subtype b